MSIKTIDGNVTTNTGGVAKKINKGAEKMVFDILQSTQYSTPIPSSVRELVTNACDSQREKEMAVEILKGTDGIGFIHLDTSDVVRHSLVKKMIEAYDKATVEKLKRKEEENE